jgi:hypothetical protein
VTEAFKIIPQHLKDAIEHFAQVNNLDDTWQNMILNTYNDVFGNPGNYSASEQEIADAKGASREEKEANVLFVELTKQKTLEELSRATVQNPVGITQDNVDDMIRQLTDNITNKRNHQDLSRENLGSIIVHRGLNTQDPFKDFFHRGNPTKLRTKSKKDEIVAAIKAEAKTLEILENIAYGVIQGEHGGDADTVWQDIRDNGTDFKQQYMNTQAGPSTPSASKPSTPKIQPKPTPQTPTGLTLGANGRKYKKSKNKAQVHLKEIAQILKKYA